MNKYDMFQESIHEARATMKQSDDWANRFVQVIIGRLRNVSHTYLCKLKKELTQYDARTRQWKS